MMRPSKAKRGPHASRLKKLPCHIFRYNEVKLFSSELEADASTTAASAERAHQSSQLHLSSLGRLPKVDTSFLQVRTFVYTWPKSFSVASSHVFPVPCMGRSKASSGVLSIRSSKHAPFLTESCTIRVSNW